ncbi:MAG: hypothetical protein HQL21_06215 [Candidatus Omnitrophica bacterium]|nr:hypothetical protein [Candidatus Omnitrophota bacterium]
MKKTIVVILGFMMVISFLGTSQAFMRKDMSLVKGKVVAYDKKKATITVDGERGEGKIVFDLKGAEIATSIEKGARVVIIYKNEGNKVTTVRPVPPGR